NSKKKSSNCKILCNKSTYNFVIYNIQLITSSFLHLNILMMFLNEDRSEIKKIVQFSHLNLMLCQLIYIHNPNLELNPSFECCAILAPTVAGSTSAVSAIQLIIAATGILTFSVIESVIILFKLNINDGFCSTCNCFPNPHYFRHPYVQMLDSHSHIKQLTVLRNSKKSSMAQYCAICEIFQLHANNKNDNKHLYLYIYIYDKTYAVSNYLTHNPNFRAESSDVLSHTCPNAFQGYNLSRSYKAAPCGASVPRKNSLKHFSTDSNKENVPIPVSMPTVPPTTTSFHSNDDSSSDDEEIRYRDDEEEDEEQELSSLAAKVARQDSLAKFLSARPTRHELVEKNIIHSVTEDQFTERRSAIGTALTRCVSTEQQTHP
ncbi:Hypothetical predicted protein, partial [Mytilus galloprovincialis]